MERKKDMKDKINKLIQKIEDLNNKNDYCGNCVNNHERDTPLACYDCIMSKVLCFNFIKK